MGRGWRLQGKSSLWKRTERGQNQAHLQPPSIGSPLTMNPRKAITLGEYWERPESGPKLRPALVLVDGDDDWEIPKHQELEFKARPGRRPTEQITGIVIPVPVGCAMPESGALFAQWTPIFRERPEVMIPFVTLRGGTERERAMARRWPAAVPGASTPHPPLQLGRAGLGPQRGQPTPRRGRWKARREVAERSRCRDRKGNGDGEMGTGVGRRPSSPEGFARWVQFSLPIAKTPHFPPFEKADQEDIIRNLETECCDIPSSGQSSDNSVAPACRQRVGSVAAVWRQRDASVTPESRLHACPRRSGDVPGIHECSGAPPAPSLRMQCCQWRQRLWRQSWRQRWRWRQSSGQQWRWRHRSGGKDGAGGIVLAAKMALAANLAAAMALAAKMALAA
eukprot:gene16124-biopygen11847